MNEDEDKDKDDTPKKPDQYRKLKFPSLVGHALTGGKDEEQIRVTTRVNCKDQYTPEAKLQFIQIVLDDFVYPEVVNRARYGILPLGFELRKAHVLMHADEYKNEVLLNEDVRFLAKITTVDRKEPSHLNEIAYEDIQDVLGLYPGKNNDQNAAHIMLLRIKDKWHFASNFVYNLELCKEKFSQSKAFFQAAQCAADSKLWAPVVDTLYSSTELAVQACLSLLHRGEFSLSWRQKHHPTMVHLSAYSSAGNLDPKYEKHLANLNRLRSRGRYQKEGNPGEKFELVDSEVRNLFNITEELINHVSSILNSAENSRNPDATAGGYVISIGQGLG